MIGRATIVSDLFICAPIMVEERRAPRRTFPRWMRQLKLGYEVNSRVGSPRMPVLTRLHVGQAGQHHPGASVIAGTEPVINIGETLLAPLPASTELTTAIALELGVQRFHIFRESYSSK